MRSVLQHRLICHIIIQATMGVVEQQCVIQPVAAREQKQAQDIPSHNLACPLKPVTCPQA